MRRRWRDGQSSGHDATLVGPPMNLAVIVVLAVLAAACSPSASPPGEAKTSPDAARRLKTTADEYFHAFVESFPIAATFAGVPEAATDRLGDNSLAFTRAWQQREDAWLKQVQQIDASSLTGGDIAT